MQPSVKTTTLEKYIEFFFSNKLANPDTAADKIKDNLIQRY